MKRRSELCAVLLSVLGAVPCISCAAGRASSASAAPTSAVGSETSRDVALLSDPSFVERSRAAERLVAQGESVLPALGALGDRPTRATTGVEVSTTRPVVRAILAHATDDRLAEHLASPHALVRREAAEEIGGRGRWSVIPRLIDRLEDPDEGVRAASHAALRRLTNRSLGYQPGAPGRQRAAATGRWRAWWNLEGHVRADREDRNRPS